jgi:hypothetical protein
MRELEQKDDEPAKEAPKVEAPKVEEPMHVHKIGDSFRQDSDEDDDMDEDEEVGEIAALPERRPSAI